MSAGEVRARLHEIAAETLPTATLTGAGGSLLRYAYRCPVVLYAYRSRDRRDTAPRSGEPDWKSPDNCGDELQEVSLHRGETRSFEVVATAREILGDSLPRGRYYFAVAVQAERLRIHLAAGEAELGR